MEAETKYRQQQNLFESVRAERNSLNKNLTEAYDEIQESKSKLKVLSHQTEQLKEDIVAKEAGLIKEEFRKRFLLSQFLASDASMRFQIN